MMDLGIFARTFPGPGIEAVFERIHSLGLNKLHFNWTCAGLAALPRKIPKSLPAQVQRVAEARRLQIIGVSATCNLIDPDPRKREQGLQSLKQIAQTCSSLGTRLISLCSGSCDPVDKWRYHPDNRQPEAWRSLLVSMERIIPWAEAHDLFLGIEPEYANVVYDARQALRLIHSMQSDRIRIIFDPANLFERAEPATIRRQISEGLDCLGPYLIQAHAKDRTCDGKVVAAGKGAIDFAVYLHQLKSLGFRGPVVLHGLAPAAVPDSLQYLRAVWPE